MGCALLEEAAHWLPRDACKGYCARHRTRKFTLLPGHMPCIRIAPALTVLDAALGLARTPWSTTCNQSLVHMANWVLIYKGGGKAHHEPLGAVSAIVSWNYRASILNVHIRAY